MHLVYFMPPHLLKSWLFSWHPTYSMHPVYLILKSRDLKFGIWDLYIIINTPLKYFLNIPKTTSGFVAKTKIVTKMVMLKKVISLWSWVLTWGTLWWEFIDIMIFKWEFRFFNSPSCERPQQKPVFPISWITYIIAVHCSSTSLSFFPFFAITPESIWGSKKGQIYSSIKRCRQVSKKWSTYIKNNITKHFITNKDFKTFTDLKDYWKTWTHRYPTPALWHCHLTLPCDTRADWCHNHEIITIIANCPRSLLTSLQCKHDTAAPTVAGGTRLMA